MYHELPVLFCVATKVAVLNYNLLRSHFLSPLINVVWHQSTSGRPLSAASMVAATSSALLMEDLIAAAHERRLGQHIHGSHVRTVDVAYTLCAALGADRDAAAMERMRRSIVAYRADKRM
jgi:hypothetical protein